MRSPAMLGPGGSAARRSGRQPAAPAARVAARHSAAIGSPLRLRVISGSLVPRPDPFKDTDQAARRAQRKYKDRPGRRRQGDGRMSKNAGTLDLRTLSPPGSPPDGHRPISPPAAASLRRPPESVPGQAPWTGPGLPPATRPLSAVPHLPTVPPRTVRRSSLPDLVAAAALVAAVLLLDLRSLHLWWSHDDFFNLHFVTDHRPWEYCFDPRVWRLLPMRLLTPLLFLSLHLDLRLFGADPLAFHAHQLAAATLAFLAFYAALRLWLPPAPAALGTGLALAGAPTLSLVQLVMARHYLEGLLLAAVAVICFGRGLARQRRWWLYLSALCYLAACLAKEIYVPLVLLFPLAAPGGAGRRLRAAAPHLAVFALYLGWRLYMLGTLGGGNGWSVRAA